MALFRPYQRPDQKPAGERPVAPVTPAPEPKAERPSRMRRVARPEKVRAEVVAAPVETVAESAEARRQPVKKDRPTPTRKQAERERMERLHPTLSPKEQKKLERRKASELRNEQYLAAENSPEKVLLRNFVDSRFHITEVLLPAMLIIMALTLFVSQYWYPLLTISSILTWVMLLLAVVDVALTWARYKKIQAQRLPNGSRRGLLMYMINRMVQFRSFRRPAPVVERGAVI